MKKRRVIKETGEWDDNDEQMKAWKQDINDKAIELASLVNGEASPAEGFDAYQGPYAHISDTPKGDVTLWSSEYDGIYRLETYEDWLEGDIETLAKKLNEDIDPTKERFTEYCKDKIKDLGTVELHTKKINPDFDPEYDKDKIIKAHFTLELPNGAKYVSSVDVGDYSYQDSVIVKGKKVSLVPEWEEGELDVAASLKFKYIDKKFYKDLLNNWESWDMSERFEDTPLEEAAKPDKNKKPTKRLVMNQGNVYIFEQSKGSKKSYIVGEDIDKDANTIEKVNKYNNQDEAFTDFFARVGIDPNNELKESIKKATKSGNSLNESGYEDCVEEDDFTPTQIYTVADLDKMEVGTPIAVKMFGIGDPIIKTSLFSGKEDDKYYFFDGDMFAFSKNFIENSGKVELNNGVDITKLLELNKSLLPPEELEEAVEETPEEKKKVVKLEIEILPELKFIWAEGNQKHVASLFGSAEEHTMDFRKFQDAVYKLDNEIQNETNPDGSAVFGYDKIKYEANIRATETYEDGSTNTEDTTYEGRVDCGDGRYGIENVRIKDLMKNFIKGMQDYKEADIIVNEPSK